MVRIEGIALSRNSKSQNGSNGPSSACGDGRSEVWVRGGCVASGLQTNHYDSACTAPALTCLLVEVYCSHTIIFPQYAGLYRRT